MQSPFAIRDVVPADLEQWLPLWEGYNAFYGREGETALPAAVTEATWRRFLDPIEPVHAMVADLDGHLVGLVHFLFHRSTIMLPQSCYLSDLFTGGEARGRGVGRALIEAVYAKARAAGSTRVYWLTHETNETAMRLYDQVARKSGFIVYRQEV